MILLVGYIALGAVVAALRLASPMLFVRVRAWLWQWECSAGDPMAASAYYVNEHGRLTDFVPPDLPTRDP